MHIGAYMHTYIYRPMSSHLGNLGSQRGHTSGSTALHFKVEEKLFEFEMFINVFVHKQM